MVVVCIVPLIHIVIKIGDSTIPPSWDKSFGECIFIKFFFQQFPKYLPYLNLRVCIVCPSVTQGASHNRFDHYMRMYVLESHLSMYGNVVFAWEISALTYSFTVYFLKLQTELSCCVDVRGVDGQYGV